MRIPPRSEQRTKLVAELEAAEAGFERGEFTEYAAAGLRALGEDVKQRGRERLAARTSTR